MKGASHRRYRILHAVGKGAFGTVYKAQMVGEGGFAKDVAIKLMNSDLEAPDEVAQRQRDEARLLGLIRHRAILQVDGLVRLNGNWAVVMEYIDGINLRELLRFGPVPPSCALQIVGEVAGALNVAWEAEGADGQPLHIIHRDIKPPNIQLTRAGEVKLLDFGVARADFGTRESETVGVILGTLRYMAPERLDGIDGPEGDVYALGVVLVELLTRKPMVKTSSNPKRHQETVDQAMGRVKEAIGDSHRDLARLIEDCLSYDPEKRPTAKQLERRSWGLAQDYPLPRLREWAESRVTEAQQHARSKMGEDDLSGATLLEQSQSMMQASSKSGSVAIESSSRIDVGRSLIGASLAGLMLMAGLGLAILAVLLFVLLGQEGPRAAVAPPVTPVLAEHDAGGNSYPIVYRERDGEEVEEDALDLRPQPIPRPIRVVPSPAPAPEPAAAPQPKAAPIGTGPGADAMGTVNVLGDATGVKMVGAKGTFSVPGKVPDGTYSVMFDGVETLKQVRVPRGRQITISCDAAFTICTQR